MIVIHVFLHKVYIHLSTPIHQQTRSSANADKQHNTKVCHRTGSIGFHGTSCVNHYWEWCCSTGHIWNPQCSISAVVCHLDNNGWQTHIHMNTTRWHRCDTVIVSWVKSRNKTEPRGKLWCPNSSCGSGSKRSWVRIPVGATMHQVYSSIPPGSVNEYQL